MLETIDLSQTLTKDEYKEKLSHLQSRLYALEWACWKNKVPILIAFEAWGGAGKGEAIKVLTEKLDPRGYVVHPIVPPNTEESMKPWMTRFWKITPAKGEMCICDKSWYTRVFGDFINGEVSKRERAQAFEDIKDFEFMLHSSGTVIFKFFLHISKKRQEKNLKKLSKDPLEFWKVSKDDWWENKHYSKYARAVEEMLHQTSVGHAPWYVIEMEDKYFGRIKVLEILSDLVTDVLKKRKIEIPELEKVEDSKKSKSKKNISKLSPESKRNSKVSSQTKKTRKSNMGGRK